MVSIINIFQNKLLKMWSDQVWEVLKTHWTRHTSIILQSTTLLEVALPPPWTINRKCTKMIIKVLCQDSQIHHQNKEKIQNNLLNIKVSSQVTTLWRFKVQQLFLNFRVFWLKDSEKHLKIEVAEESSVSQDNSKSLMTMVQEILILMNSLKQLKISKFKLKK